MNKEKEADVVLGGCVQFERLDYFYYLYKINILSLFPKSVWIIYRTRQHDYMLILFLGLLFKIYENCMLFFYYWYISLQKLHYFLQTQLIKRKINLFAFYDLTLNSTLKLFIFLRLWRHEILFIKEMKKKTCDLLLKKNKVPILLRQITEQISYYVIIYYLLEEILLNERFKCYISIHVGF